MIGGKHYFEDYKPVNVFQNNIKLAGWENETKTGETVEFDNTYNDFAEVLVGGKTEQDGTPSPEYPSDIKSVGTYNADTMKYEFDVISSGKNLFSTDFIGTNIYVTNIDKNNLSVSGGYGNTMSSHNLYQRLTPNTTYSISLDISANGVATGSYGRISLYKGSSYFYLYEGAGGSGHKTSTFTTPADLSGYSNLLIYGSSDKSATVNLSNIQIELGSTATTYEPFRGYNQTTISLDAPLNKIGDVEDTYNSLTGEFVQRIGKRVLDGTEAGWQKYSANPSSNVYYINFTGSAKGYGLSRCSHFKQLNIAWDLPASTGYGFYSDHQANNNKYFNIGSMCPTIADFKAWLAAEYAAGTPVTVLYQLSTPITTYLTPTQVPTFYPTTIISTTNTEIKPTLTATLKTFQ